jgi:KDO2-lipid IV(A) lauroyltransferase
MNGAPPGARCGLDTVEIARVARLLGQSGAGGAAVFSDGEMRDAGDGPGRAATLAGRFAAKEACCKLFPRETALGIITPADFTIRRDSYGAPSVEPGPAAQPVLDRHRIARIRVSITHTGDNASAIAWAEPRQTVVPWYGSAVFYLLPWRRGLVLTNLKRVFGETLSETEIEKLAKAYYGHFARFLIEVFRFPFMSAKKRAAWIRVENMESPTNAHTRGKGILVLTGHFGNWEASTVAGIGQFPQYKDLFHFVRRPLKPAWLNELVTRRFRRAGLGSISKFGSLDTILDLLAAGHIIVFVFDQHAGRRDGVTVDFFGEPSRTFKSLAIIAINTGTPVVPAHSWREPDGSHVLRFEDPLPLIECDDPSEAIRRNTRAYNAAIERMLLRHPEQWIWMHRRWKKEDISS